MSDRDTTTARVRLGRQGRIVIPAQLRAEMGIKEGDPLVLRVVDGQLTIETPAAILRRIQDYVARVDPDAGSMVDELIAERREEARREAEEFGPK